MNPTQDSRIRETQWFVNPANPLMEYKIFTARVDNLVYFITAERGITKDSIPVNKSKDVPIAVTITETDDYFDNSGEQFQKLVKLLNSPAK